MKTAAKEFAKSIGSKLQDLFLKRIKDDQISIEGTILVGESDPSERRRIQSLFNRKGYKVEFEADSLQLIAKALKSNPDLILIDADIKGGYGSLATAHYFRSRLNIPVILMMSPKSIYRYRNIKYDEIDGMIVKPIKDETIFRNAETAINEKRYTAVLKRSQPSSFPQVLFQN